MNKLYVIRHGKTDWNNLRLMQGRVDIPLNEEGRADALINVIVNYIMYIIESLWLLKINI